MRTRNRNPMPRALWLTIAFDGRGRPDPALGPARRLHTDHRHRARGAASVSGPPRVGRDPRLRDVAHLRARPPCPRRTRRARGRAHDGARRAAHRDPGGASVARPCSRDRPDVRRLPALRPDRARRVLAVVRELPWLGPRIADQLVGVLADSAALERLILAHAGGWAAAVATAAGNVGRNVLDAVLALLTLFFLYRDGHLLAPQIQAGLRRVGGARFAAMFDPLGRTVRAVIYGTLFTALSPGVLAMVGYLAARLRTPLLPGAGTVLLALTPVGAALVYVSASAWLLVEGRVLAGVLLLAWGVLVVSLADNLIRSWFLRGATRVPFLLGFFGVIGGVATFGAVGLFLGPIAIALLLALWREWVAAP